MKTQIHLKCLFWPTLIQTLWYTCSCQSWLAPAVRHVVPVPCLLSPAEYTVAGTACFVEHCRSGHPWAPSATAFRPHSIIQCKISLYYFHLEKKIQCCTSNLLQKASFPLLMFFGEKHVNIVYKLVVQWGGEIGVAQRLHILSGPMPPQGNQYTSTQIPINTQSGGFEVKQAYLYSRMPLKAINLSQGAWYFMKLVHLMFSPQWAQLYNSFP